MTREIGSRIPPHSLEAEQSVLGSVLIDPEMLEVCRHLPREAFYQSGHQHLWDAILKVSSVGVMPDMVTLQVELERTRKLEAIGGTAYLAGLSDLVPTAIYAESYTRILEEKYALRQLISRAGQVMSAAYSGEGSLENQLEQASRISQNLDSSAASLSVLTQADLTSNLLAQLEVSDAPRSLPTGLNELDNTLGGGLENGALYVVAARPGNGKTALMMQLAHHAARTGAGTIAVFSLEMPAVRLSDRLIASLSGISSNELRMARRGEMRLSPVMLERITAQAANLANLPLRYFDNPAVTLSQLARELRMLKSREGLALLCVDYLQLINVPGVLEDVKRLSDISRTLKLLARELEIPVVALSQLSRAVESRQDRHPMLSDLRSSGSIEQDADAVLMLYRGAYYDKSLSGPLEDAEIMVLKNRDGETRTVNVTWEPARVRFLNKEVIGKSTLQTPDSYFDNDVRGMA